MGSKWLRGGELWEWAPRGRGGGRESGPRASAQASSGGEQRPPRPRERSAAAGEPRPGPKGRGGRG